MDNGESVYILNAVVCQAGGGVQEYPHLFRILNSIIGPLTFCTLSDRTCT